MQFIMYFFALLLVNIMYGNLTVEYNLLFEQCSAVPFTEDPTLYINCIMVREI